MSNAIEHEQHKQQGNKELAMQIKDKNETNTNLKDIFSNLMQKNDKINSQESIKIAKDEVQKARNKEILIKKLESIEIEIEKTAKKFEKLMNNLIQKKEKIHKEIEMESNIND